MEELKTNLGCLVRKKRKEFGLTQEKLAEKINVSSALIGQIEREETSPSVETLNSLIKLLGLDPREIFFNIPQGDSMYFELFSLMQEMDISQQKLLIGIAKLISKKEGI